MTRNHVSVLGVLAAALVFAGCSMGQSTVADPKSGDTAAGSSSGGTTSEYGPPADTSSGAGGSGGSGRSDFSGGSVAPSSSSSGGDGGVIVAPAGQLTAADWDDNLNFGLFLNYANAFAAANQALPSPAAADRVVITVTDEAGAPLSNARVKVADATGTRLEAPTGTDGRLLFFPAHDQAVAGASFTVTIDPPAGAAGTQVVAAAPAGSSWNFVVVGASAALAPALDVAFVVDVTGSMSDELEYLKTEIDAIATAVSVGRPGVSVRYGLVVYRDLGDTFVTRSFDFSDVATFKANLAAQSSDGGGDYPEAVDQALAAARALSWRSGNVARLSFLIADAPPHDDKAPAFMDQVNLFRTGGIRLYPVGASGVGDVAEYLFRLAAQSTLGRYLWLTDDSGIGGSHAEPHLPCYQVQLLSKLMVRMIESELAGSRVPAAPADVLRATGSPTGTSCAIADGGTAAF